MCSNQKIKMAKIKTPEELKKAFKKSRQERKDSIVNRAGLKTHAEYLERLDKLIAEGESPKATTPTPVKAAKPKVHVVNLLDVSGSMSGQKINSAVAGINSELKAYKESKDVDYVVTLTAFDHDRKPQLVRVVGKNLPSSYVYRGIMGGTALNDAICLTLKELMKETLLGEQTLVNIFTDGLEYHSKTYSAGDVKKYITEAESRGFTITFIGDTRDVGAVSKRYGIDASNTLGHDNTAKGVQEAFATKLDATVLYSTNVAAGKNVSRGFYKRIIT